jgi:hypothetical protein
MLLRVVFLFGFQDLRREKLQHKMMSWSRWVKNLPGPKMETCIGKRATDTHLVPQDVRVIPDL